MISSCRCCRWGLEVALVLATLWGAVAARAEDGVVEINQSSALAGGITPGDAPGFPVTISVSGSYRLTSNLTVGDANTSGVRIETSNVSVDLNGHAIVGVVTCAGSGPTLSCGPTGTGVGVQAVGTSNQNIIVRDGTIRGMGLRGVSIQGDYAIIEGVHIENSDADGILNQGPGIIDGCVTYLNEGRGVLVSGSNVVVRTHSKWNQSDGLNAGENAVLRRNTSHENGGNGLRTFHGSLAMSNSLINNAGAGLENGSAAGSDVAYGQNNIDSNPTTVSGTAVQVDGNACNGNIFCP